MAYGTTFDRERERVREIRDDLSGWRRWGPYVSDRSWGTVREDYSHDGNAWEYLTYDKARSHNPAMPSSPQRYALARAATLHRLSGTNAIRT